MELKKILTLAAFVASFGVAVAEEEKKEEAPAAETAPAAEAPAPEAPAEEGTK